jgi:hypothetical protein
MTAFDAVGGCHSLVSHGVRDALLPSLSGAVCHQHQRSYRTKAPHDSAATGTSCRRSRPDPSGRHLTKWNRRTRPGQHVRKFSVASYCIPSRRSPRIMVTDSMIFGRFSGLTPLPLSGRFTSQARPATRHLLSCRGTGLPAPPAPDFAEWQLGSLNGDENEGSFWDQDAQHVVGTN